MGASFRRLQRVVCLLVLGVAGAGAGPAGAQVAIDHDALNCVVAEKFPRLTACFAPRSRVARARVYFRAEGAPHWYFVEMTSDAPCFRGVLPKPSRQMHSFNYYVAVTDREFQEAQTTEYAPEVVPDEKSCKKGPLAPFLNKASVVLGSGGGAAAIPQGFLGAGIAGAGLSTTAIVAGTVAVVGGGVAGVGAITGGEGAPPSTIQAGPTTTLPVLPPAPSTTLAGPTTTTLPPSGPTTTLPAPPTTTLPAPATTTTTLPGPTTTTLPGPTTTTTTSTSSTTTTTTTLPGPTTTTTSTSTTSTTSTSTTSTTSTTTLSSCAGDLGPPTVQFLTPSNGSIVLLGPVALTAMANDPDGFPVTVTYTLDSGAVLGSSTSPNYQVLWQPCGLIPAFKLEVRAVDRCGKTSAVDTRNVAIIGLPICFQSGPSTGAGFVSQLTVPGGRGQVVLNGTDGVFPGAGLVRVPARVQGGQNRVEATLVAGGAGTWRFDLSGLAAPGSLRVLAGEVALTTPEQIVFRLKGRTGERVVFSFTAEGPAQP